mmetsp:Transcript_9540/g.34959  ORF Transcript_9540/g.34959 Transcript_9540/m.34959 type:complete len:1568 (-) Transcript_9540:108-4811(-)
MDFKSLKARFEQQQHQDQAEARPAPARSPLRRKQSADLVAAANPTDAGTTKNLETTPTGGTQIAQDAEGTVPGVDAIPSAAEGTLPKARALRHRRRVPAPPSDSSEAKPEPDSPAASAEATNGKPSLVAGDETETQETPPTTAEAPSAGRVSSSSEKVLVDEVVVTDAEVVYTSTASEATSFSGFLVEPGSDGKDGAQSSAHVEAAATLSATTTVLSNVSSVGGTRMTEGKSTDISEVSMSDMMGTTAAVATEVLLDSETLEGSTQVSQAKSETVVHTVLSPGAFSEPEAVLPATGMMTMPQAVSSVQAESTAVTTVRSDEGETSTVATVTASGVSLLDGDGQELEVSAVHTAQVTTSVAEALDADQTFAVQTDITDLNEVRMGDSILSSASTSGFSDAVLINGTEVARVSTAQEAIVNATFEADGSAQVHAVSKEGAQLSTDQQEIASQMTATFEQETSETAEGSISIVDAHWEASASGIEKASGAIATGFSEATAFDLSQVSALDAITTRTTETSSLQRAFQVEDEVVEVTKSHLQESTTELVPNLLSGVTESVDVSEVSFGEQSLTSAGVATTTEAVFSSELGDVSVLNTHVESHSTTAFTTDAPLSDEKVAAGTDAADLSPEGILLAQESPAQVHAVLSKDEVVDASELFSTDTIVNAVSTSSVTEGIIGTGDDAIRIRNDHLDELTTATRHIGRDEFPEGLPLGHAGVAGGPESSLLADRMMSVDAVFSESRAVDISEISSGDTDVRSTAAETTSEVAFRSEVDTISITKSHLDKVVTTIHHKASESLVGEDYDEEERGINSALEAVGEPADVSIGQTIDTTETVVGGVTVQTATTTVSSETTYQSENDTVTVNEMHVDQVVTTTRHVPEQLLSSGEHDDAPNHGDLTATDAHSGSLDAIDRSDAPASASTETAWFAEESRAATGISFDDEGQEPDHMSTERTVKQDIEVDTYGDEGDTVPVVLADSTRDESPSTQTWVEAGHVDEQPLVFETAGATSVESKDASPPELQSELGKQQEAHELEKEKLLAQVESLRDELAAAKDDMFKMKLDLETQTLAAASLVKEKNILADTTEADKQTALDELRASLHAEWEDKLAAEIDKTQDAARLAAEAEKKEWETASESIHGLLSAKSEELSAISAERDQIEADKKAAEACVSSLQEELASLNERLSASEALAEEIRETSTRGEILEADMRTLRTEYDEQSEKLCGLQEAMEESEQRSAKLQEELSLERVAASSTQASLATAEARVSELEQAQMKSLEFAAETAQRQSSLEEENARLVAEVERLQEDKKGMEEEHKLLTTNLAEEQAMRALNASGEATLQESNTSLIAERDSLLQSIEELKAVAQEKEASLKSELMITSEKLASLQTEAESAASWEAAAMEAEESARTKTQELEICKAEHNKKEQEYERLLEEAKTQHASRLQRMESEFAEQLKEAAATGQADAAAKEELEQEISVLRKDALALSQAEKRNEEILEDKENELAKAYAKIEELEEQLAHVAQTTAKVAPNGNQDSRVTELETKLAEAEKERGRLEEEWKVICGQYAALLEQLNDFASK